MHVKSKYLLVGYKSGAYLCLIGKFEKSKRTKKVQIKFVIKLPGQFPYSWAVVVGGGDGVDGDTVGDDCPETDNLGKILI